MKPHFAALLLALLTFHGSCAAGQPPAPTPPGDPVGSEIVPAPTWAQLSPAARQTLAPLSGHFDQLSAQQRRKWISMAERAPGWSPEKLRMIQSRMVQWATMTPEQHAAARQQAMAARGARAQSWQKWKKLDEGARNELHGKALAAPAAGPAPAAK